MTAMPSSAKPPAPPPQETRAADQLVAAGLRVTYGRVQVLEVLAKATRPASHADIEATLSVPMDKVTLYRTLDRLVAAGLLRKTVGDDRITRFACMDDAQHHQHAHFHCDECGMVYCLPVKPPKAPKVPEGFVVDSLDLHVHGHCSNCNRTEPQD